MLFGERCLHHETAHESFFVKHMATHAGPSWSTIANVLPIVRGLELPDRPPPPARHSAAPRFQSSLQLSPTFAGSSLGLLCSRRWPALPTKGSLEGCHVPEGGRGTCSHALASLIPPRHLAPHLYRESMHLSLQPTVSRTGSRIDVPGSCD